jgi:hypothetical protein
MSIFILFSNQINTAYILTPAKFNKLKNQKIKPFKEYVVLVCLILSEKGRKAVQVVILL